jgi:hypothetical protein
VRWPPASELDSWSNEPVVGYSPAGKDIEDFMYAAVTVIFRVCKPVRLLSLRVVCVIVQEIQSPTQTRL